MAKVEAFERHTEAYDEWFVRHRDLYRAELEAVRQLMPPAGAEAVEVGVGTGRFAAPLGIRVGVEPSARMAARARRLGIEVHPGVAEDLPFPDGAFDLVLMVTTICFVDDPARALREAWRVLGPGGSVIVGFVDRESALGRRYAARRDESRFYRDATFFTSREVLGLLGEAGFEPVGIRQTVFEEGERTAVAEGFGKGSFVAIRAVKTSGRAHPGSGGGQKGAP